MHDLNQEPTLPFDEESFDCGDLHGERGVPHPAQGGVSGGGPVLRPGGVLAVAFSNRFFPPKAVHLWKELHDFEKLGSGAGLLYREQGF